MELQNLFDALRKATPETVLETAYKMFRGIQYVKTMYNGFELLAFYHALLLYEANIPADETLSTGALKKLKASVLAQLHLVADETKYKGIKGIFCSTSLEKAIVEYKLDEYSLEANEDLLETD